MIDQQKWRSSDGLFVINDKNYKKKKDRNRQQQLLIKISYLCSNFGELIGASGHAWPWQKFSANESAKIPGRQWFMKIPWFISRFLVLWLKLLVQRLIFLFIFSDIPMQFDNVIFP